MYEFRKEDALRFSDHVGIQTRTYRNELIFNRCPYCKGREKDKKTFSINLETGQFNCFRASCGVRGNMITIAKDFNFSISTEMDEFLKSQYHKSRYGTWKPKPVKNEAVEFMASRGISKEITEKYGIGVHKDDKSILIFPFVDDAGELQMAKFRNTKQDASPKEWCDAGAYTILFGMNHCKPEEDSTLIITEGQIDSLSVAEAGFINAVSVPTGKNGFTWFPHCYDFLCKFKKIVVFGDCERDEVTLYHELKNRCSKKWNVCCVRKSDYKGCKDANEILLEHGKEAIIAAVNNAEPERNKRIIPMWMVKHQSLADKEKIVTSFNALNNILAGGMYMAQVGLFTGARGNGKSTLVNQITIDALKSYPVFVYSAELQNWQIKNWMSRQLVGKEFVKLTDDKEDFELKSDVIEERVDNYLKEKGLYLYDTDVIDEEDDESLLDLMLECFNRYGCRVFVIDNLMTAISDDASSDLYRQQSNFMKDIKRFAKTHDVLVLLVAHPRKSDSRNLVNDDVSGSSNITNLVDFVINFAKAPADIQEDGEDYTNVRFIHVLKNRAKGKLTGESGIRVYFEEESRRLSTTGRFHEIDYGVMPKIDSDKQIKITDQNEVDALELPFEV